MADRAQEAVVAEIQLAHGSKHNICAHLDYSTNHAQEFEDIIHLLLRSRISYAIATKHDAHREHLQAFWTTATFQFMDGVPMIYVTIANHEIIVMEDDIRRVCRFGDDKKAKSPC
ncbi:hypothetical protein E3N88_16779 [Mikania micrantha]|uniref:Uncharacterized protein n=1 Tax=Mikania micrantha TaxID=192012 RepID=A0A5N6NRT1_9ASTR|nr:hypothetical protein E3N88_16779 [Mikania micrantha]